MGSFANSIHVRSDDPAAVAGAIERIMEASDYESTEQTPDVEVAWGMSTRLRAFRVGEPKDGWVAVLDSNMMGTESMAGALSEELDTWAISVTVLDSDDWQWWLFQSGEMLDYFDTMSNREFDEMLAEELFGDEMFDDDMFDEDMLDEDMLDDWSGMDDFEQSGDLLDRIVALSTQMQDTMAEHMPEEIAEIQEKALYGDASPEELAQLTKWSDEHGSEMHNQMLGQMRELFPHMVADLERAQASEDAETTDTDNASDEADEQSAHDYADALRPLLVDGADGAHVAAVLETRSTFAEDDLARFLRLIGVAPTWANLSYRYYEQYTEEQLAEKDIAMTAHLTYGLRDADDTGGPSLELI